MSKLIAKLKKLSIFDLGLIILGLLIVISIYFLFKRDVRYVVARFRVTEDNMLYTNSSPKNEFIQAFNVGDTEKSEFGSDSSEIVDVDAYKINPSDYVVYVDVKLKAVFNPRTEQYTFRGKSVVVGESFVFNFTDIRFRAIVIDVPSIGKHENVFVTTTVKAQLRNDSRYFSDVFGVPNFIANAIHKGDSVKDSKGNKMVEIVDVNILPAKRTMVLNDGRIFQVDDDTLKDVFMTINLYTKKIDDSSFMFNYIPVTIGAYIPINMPHLEIYPIITEIVDIK